jgi:ComF family protein
MYPMVATMKVFAGGAFCERKPLHFWNRIGVYLLDFLYPPVCLLCDERIVGDAFLCFDCARHLEDSLCVRIHSGRDGFPHLSGGIYLDGALTGWGYTPKIEALIHRVKYQRGRKLGAYLGRLMGLVLGPHLAGDQEEVIMVPVPLHAIRKRERGYNQSDLLCAGLKQDLPLDIRSRGLVRCRNTSTQTKLNAEERERNVKDAFAVNKNEDFEGKRVVLVDDVITTGATMNSIAACLKAAGTLEVLGVALARPVLD